MRSLTSSIDRDGERLVVFGNVGDADVGPQRRAVLALVAHLVFVRGDLAPDERAERLERPLAVRLVAQLGHRFADELAPFVAQHLVEGGVGLFERAVDVDDHDAERGALEDGPEPGFGARQRDLRLESLGLVAQRHRPQAGSERPPQHHEQDAARHHDKNCGRR